MNTTKRSFLTSLVSLILCFTMFLGTTFAWFTDLVVSKDNVIESGKLDAEMYWSDDFLAADDNGWKQVKENKPIFTYNKWEPGYTEVKYIKVANEGNLNFKWKLTIEAEGEVTELSDVIDVYYVNPVTAELTKTALADLTPDGTLTDVLENKTGEAGSLTRGTSTVLAIAFHMDELANNDYQGKELCKKGFSLKLVATQATGESDSFDDKYDEQAQWPEGIVIGNTASANVTADAANKTSGAVTMTSADGKISANVPAGTKLDAGASQLTLNVANMDESKANITLDENEASLSIDVHILGVAKDNDVVMEIYVKELLPVGLNMGNYRFYHVENGQTVEMTLLTDGATPVHNDYEYDPATGDVVLYLASFSEVTLVADNENAWEGKFDYSWYNTSDTYFEIANADQLAAFGAIVGGMAKDENGKFLISYNDSDGDEHHNDTFDGKTVKLLADINLGDDEKNNKDNIIFYPIGYWNSEGSYEKTGTAISSGFYTFQGTFDGNGNTISNFYQNTWEMKGDHDWYDATLQYYRDGMGLFGRVLGGTIKNLTVDNFSCDSEIGTSGVIASYADSKDGKPAVFENITITNCNPRVYNIGNGGIVGCAGWYSRNNDLGNADYTNAVTFRNITVDQSNKISALWGSWGVSCAGILGQYYPNSNCGIKMENCHVAAIIDVNNDVCSNYQYYWYRYAGMFIGTIRANKVAGDGYTIADTTGIFATGCTYTMGDWNEYWYCEIVANSLASYTHDHQFSRLDKIKHVSEIQDENGNWNKEGHFVIPAADNSSATCYHIFRNSAGELYQHFHDVADESNPNIYEDFDLDGNGKLDDLKEDRQCYFIPFNQLMTGLDMGIRAFFSFEDFEKYGVENMEFTLKEDGAVKSEEKFTATQNIQIEENDVVSIGDLFTASGKGTISSPNVQVYVSPVGDESTVSANYVADIADWFNGTLTFSGKGAAKITITDYYFCTPTTIIIEIEEHEHVYDNNCDTTCDACGEEREITHTYTSAVTAPTCTAGGYTTYTCTCGDSYTDNATAALGHSYNTVVTAPTCTAGGYTTYTCSTCGHSYVGNEVDATGHKYSTVINPPTCTKEGYTTYTCSCGDSYIADEVAKLDHTYNAVVTSPTCTEAGYTTYTCSCGDSYVADEVAALGHIETKFTGDFLYRVGNQNSVDLGSLFNIGKHSVTVSGTPVAGNASVTVTGSSLQFNGTGVVKVTLAIDCTCNECDLELNLEVVDAKNITSVASSLDGTDVVLLNNIKVTSNGTINYRYCTVYGNGFEIDVRGGMNKYNSKQGHGIIIAIDAVLDNIVIVGDVYDKYGAYSDQEDYTSAIDATNTVIQNCHISNCSAPVRANGVTIKNTTLYGGTVANLLISGGLNTLENVTTVNYNDGRGVIGFGIVITDGANENVKLILNGELKQYNFISENDISLIKDSNAQKLFNEMFTNTYSNYHITKDNVKYVNPGILSMVDTFDSTDITNNTNNGYIGTAISYKVLTEPYRGYLYSMISSGNTVDNGYDVNNDVHKATIQGDYLPDFNFDLGNQTISKDGEDDNRYLIGDKNGLEALYQSNEEAISLDLTKLANVLKYSTTTLAVSVSYKDLDGNIIGTDTIVQLTKNGIIVFTVTDNVFYDSNGEKLDKSVNVIFEVPVTVSEKEATIPNAVITVSKTSINGDYNSSKYMTFNPLEAITIKDYDANGNATTVTLNKNISSKTVEYKNSASGAWGGATITITYTDGRVLIVYLGTSTLNSPGSSNGGKTITIQSDGSIKTDGKVANSSATGGTWTIDGYSFKGNNGSTVSNNTKVTVNFADESGCVTSDTLVMLADGTQKRIDEVTYEDQLLVWNFFTGDYDVVPAAIIFYHGEEMYRVLSLNFSDGTTVKVINVHGFFDVEANEFVMIDEYNVDSFVGHNFAKVDGENYKSVELIGYEITDEYTGCYSIQSAFHINFITEGMFSLTLPPFEGWFDYFEIGEGMKYDEEKMQTDIEQYGLYTYEDFADYVTYEQFIAFNGPYLKVLVGRGVLTFEEILELIATYVS